MDWLKPKEKLVDVLKKYRYALLVLLIGIVLILLPSPKASGKEDEGIIAPTENILSLEDELSNILSTVQGAGKVQVMLTVSYGEETLYQSDTDSSGTSDIKSDTVIVTDSERNEQGLVRQVNPPKYMGAIIVCQGADSPAVRLNIVEAVSKVTGLGSDKISVLKMK